VHTLCFRWIFFSLFAENNNTEQTKKNEIEKIGKNSNCSGGDESQPLIQYTLTFDTENAHL